jgi:GT2 family glycosyltransferase/glycosyltransferase involved in cell wall biosynthesis/predicted  nucleic acid-binding Zn-ribbon protein
MKESVGILYDNISGNTGDVAIGLSIKKILKDMGVGYEELIPGRFNPNNYNTIIIGGGHLIRPSPDFFYDKFKINGQHILNTVGIVGSPDDLDYLKDYKYITVRSSWDKEQLFYLKKEVHVVPCTTMLLEDLDNIPVIPKKKSLGIHLTPNFFSKEEEVQFIEWISTLPFKIYFLPITHYNQDYIYLNYLSSRVKESVLLPLMNPLEIFTFIGKLDFFISCSLHGAIFSYRHNVPFILYNYDEKMLYFMKDRGLQNYIFTNFNEMKSSLITLFEEVPDYSDMISRDLSLLEKHVQYLREILPSGNFSEEDINEYKSLNNYQIHNLQSQIRAYESHIRFADEQMAHIKHFLSNIDIRISSLTQELNEMRQGITDRDVRISSLTQELNEMRQDITDRDVRISSLTQELNEMRQGITDRDVRISSLTQELNEMRQDITDRDVRISSLTQELNEMRQGITDRDVRISSLIQELNEMRRSVVWNLTMKYHNCFVERVLSSGTKRRELYDLGLKGTRILANDGLGSFCNVATQYIRHKRNSTTNIEAFDKTIFKKWDEDFGPQEIALEVYKSLSYKPRISIIMPTWNTEEKWLRRAIESVKNQIYDNWELCIADGGSTKSDTKNVLQEYADSDTRIILKYLPENMDISGNSNNALNLASGDFVGFLDHDDELTPYALIENVKLLNLHPEADLIYSDHAKIDENGLIYDQEFKPDWSPELLLSYCYIGHLKIIRKSILDEVGGFRSQFDGSQDYDLLLRVTEKTENVYHIPEILYLWRATKKSLAQSACSKPYSIERGRMAVEDALERRGIRGEVLLPDFASRNRLGIYEIKFSIKYRELVTIIIPTKDNVELLKRCVDSIEAKTTYDDYEILILDNGSEKKETMNFFESSINKYRIIKVITEGFNFSELVNFGVSQAKGDIIVLLNDDTEVITPSWIEDMLGWIQSDDKIGAVGCKLIYGDGSIQHAGVVLGMCSHPADHAFKLRHYKDGGYLNYANVVRNYSAVTAACLMTKKSAFNQIGGFDDENLPISFNDVDYCLRLIENDFRVVYTPKAMLYHHEGKSRGIGEQIDRPQEIEFFESKWGDLIFEDRFYNKNLSLSGHDFKFKSDDRVLLISHNLNTEGAPILLFNLGKQLKKKGYEVAVVSPHDGALKKDYSQHRIKSYIYESDNILNFIEYYKPKVALVNTIVSFKYIKLLKSCGIRIIWILHESERDLYFRDLRGLNELPFEIADSVVFVSDATRNVYEDLNKSKNFVTIHNGIDLSEIEEFIKNNDKKVLRSQLGYPENALIITTVGTVCPRKDQETFVKAAVDLLSDSASIDIELCFLVVGANGEGTPLEISYLKQIKNIIEIKGCNRHINIIYRSEIPERSDVLKFYMISDIYVCASAIEAFPITILEAMSFSLPVVSTDVFGIQEQIVDNETGLFFNLGDYRDLSRKIATLMDQDVRKKLGENSFSKLNEKFTIEKMATQYEKLIIYMAMLGN